MTNFPKVILLALLFLTIPAIPSPAQDADLHPLSQDPHPLRDKVMEMKAQPEYAAYAGWLDYLLHQAEWKKTSEDKNRLEEWVDRLETGEDPLPSMRGPMFWAHLSAVDDRGQPMGIGVPDDYDPSKEWPLEVYLHGYGGFLKPSFIDSESYDKPYFQVWPYARALGGGYDGLGDVDVREAMDYVMEHWNIDPDRVHLQGSSMGAWGVMTLATRYPDRFASARPMAGASNSWPLGNVINLPIFSVHGGFDDIVPQVLMETGFEKLTEMGGRMAFYSDDRHGHAARFSQPTMSHYDRIIFKQQRRLDVEDLNYTAVTGEATGAYWARIEEWGPEGKPARINLRLTGDNALFAAFENVDVVKLDMTKAPVDRDEALEVLIPEQIAIRYPAPLPDTLYLVRSSRGPSGADWVIQAEAPAKPDYRLHTPGGLRLLYGNEPLMIVYGTMAWHERNDALKLAAELASLSPKGAWDGPDSQTRESWSVNQMTYGKLKVKADVDVTEEDIQTHNLLLLGDPRHNKIIQQMQKGLPVQLNGTHIRTSDGLSWSYKGATMGLLYYNPLAPERLIYWIVSDRTEDFGPAPEGKTTLTQIGAGDEAPDFLIMDASSSELLAARRFDSRWRWEAGYKESPVFSEAVPLFGPDAALAAETHRRATGADYAMARHGEWEAKQLRARAHVTRLADVEALLYGLSAGVLTLPGHELLKLYEATVGEGMDASGWTHMEMPPVGRMVPPVNPAKIDPQAPYTVSMESHQIFLSTILTPADTRDFELTDVTLQDAWETYAPVILRE